MPACLPNRLKAALILQREKSAALWLLLGIESCFVRREAESKLIVCSIAGEMVLM